MKNTQQRIINYQLLNNFDVEAHDQHQLEHLVKRAVIDEKILEYNKMLCEFLKESKRKGSKVGHVKGLQVLSEIDRVQLNNNQIKSEEELMLKIKGAQKLSKPEIEQILLNKKSKH